MGFGQVEEQTRKMLDLMHFDCNAALNNFFGAWSPEKKHWCCTKQGKGCEGSRPPAVDAGPGMVWKRTQVNGHWTWVAVAVGRHYDCYAGYSNWYFGWSVSKKGWCCDHENRGCPGTWHGSYIYDCSAGFSNWLQGWSASKKDWCCRKAHKGCVKYHCTGNADLWAYEKRKWCCGHFRKGCAYTTLSPLKCDTPCELHGETETCLNRMKWNAEHILAGRSNRCALAYSKVQVECDVCRSCSFQAACEVHSVGTLPFDCNAALKNFFRAWSPVKKHWCCTKQGKGCEGPIPPTVDPGHGMVWKHALVNGYWTWQAVAVGRHCTGNADLWANEKRKWCCDFFRKGCTNRMRLHSAAARGDVQEVDEILTKVPQAVNAKGDGGQTLLAQAIISGSEATVQAVLRHRADVNAVMKRGYTALVVAASQGTANMVQDILNSRANPNAHRADGSTALTLAAETGHAATVRIILGSSNADINTVTHFGETALMLASHSDKESAAKVRSILAHKPNLQVTRPLDGSTALHLALHSGHVASAKLLVKAGAKKNPLTLAGETPLMKAVQKGGNRSTIRWLVRHGAQVDQRSKSGMTALRLSKQKQFSDHQILRQQLRHLVRSMQYPNATLWHTKQAKTESNIAKAKELMEREPEAAVLFKQLLQLARDEASAKNLSKFLVQQTPQASSTLVQKLGSTTWWSAFLQKLDAAKYCLAWGMILGALGGSALACMKLSWSETENSSNEDGLELGARRIALKALVPTAYRLRCQAWRAVEAAVSFRMISTSLCFFFRFILAL